MADVLYHYYVEGENEEKVVNTLKSELRYIQPGKVSVFDVVKKHMTKNRLMRLKQGTVVVLVFDTDTDSAEILKENIALIKKQKAIKKLICITQVKNLEDELVRSCEIRNARELTGSRSITDYKRDLNSEKNLGAKLVSRMFDIDKFWSKEPEGVFRSITNDAKMIKLK